VVDGLDPQFEMLIGKRNFDEWSKKLEDARNQIESFISNSAVPTVAKLRNFPVYTSRQSIARFRALSELFTMQLNVKGSVVECGVFEGSGLFTYAHLSAILEPANYHRKIIGFDSFEGFPNFTEFDQFGVGNIGSFIPPYETYLELIEAAKVFNQNIHLETKEKIELIKGDAIYTIPDFLIANPHFICSMLYLDFDIFEPTKIAIENFLPRMPKGAILAFDEIHNPNWPGESQALLKTIGIRNLELRCFPYDPHISFAVI
jgi:hypothetical protein